MLKGKGCILFVLFCLISYSKFSRADVNLEQVNQSITFLLDKVISRTIEGDLDISAAETSIAVLSSYMNDHQLSVEDSILGRRVRALSLKEINLQRLHSGERVDVTQAEQTLNDIDFIIKNNGSKDWLFTAGHISMHLLQHPVLAYQYWEQCASSGHAGCMNIMATHRFTGENGLPIDLQKSVYWHKRVYETGTDYQCAGVFSAHELSKMAFLFPTLDTGDTWENWLQKRNELVDKVELQSENTDHCSMSGYYFNDYVLHGTNVLGKSPLNDAIELAKDLNQKIVFEVVNNNSNLDKTIPYLENIEAEPEQCATALSVLFYAKNKNQVDAFNSLENYLLALSPEFCATEQMIIQRLQNDGRWQPNGKFAPLRQSAF
jgi:hypothetical protein